MNTEKVQSQPPPPAPPSRPGDPSVLRDDPPVLPADHLRPPGDPGTVVVDLRPAAAYLGGHLPGAIHLPPSAPGDPRLAELARLLPPHAPLILLGGTETGGWDEVLSRVGLGPVRGLLPPSALGAWARAGGRLEAVPPMTLAEALDGARAGVLTLLDLREEGDPLPADPARVVRLPLADWTPERVQALPRPLAVVSREGRWSPAACGLLRRLGVKEVWEVVGGVDGGSPGP
jgi:rhodanese-related sulfurtransferase